MRVSGKRLASEVAAFYGLTLEDMQSPVRVLKLAVPRQVCMYMLRTYAMHLSYPRIGQILNRDHTTILHGVRKVEGLIQSDPCFAQDIAELQAHLGDFLNEEWERQKAAGVSLKPEEERIERNISRLYTQLAHEYGNLAAVRAEQSVAA